MTKRKFSLLITVLAMLALVVIPASAGISGTGLSGVQVQNLSGSSEALVTVELWNQAGGSPVAISASGGDSIPVLGAKNYYLPSLTNVPDGAYSMIVNADQPVAAIARTDWSATGGAAIYDSVDPATDVIIPLITGNYANQTSQFSIQNTNTDAAINDVTITLYGRGSSTPVKVLNNQSIPAGTSVTYNLNDTGVWGTLPNNNLDTGVMGFVGSVRIQSGTPIVAQSFIDLAGSPGVTGFVGVPTNSNSTNLYCPLIRANYYGDTGISITNPNNAEVTATITFRSDAGSPQQGTFTQDVTVPANSSYVAFQGFSGDSRAAGLPGGSGQTGANPTPTNNGFYGVASIEASAPVLAVVNDTMFGAGWAVEAQSSYNCKPETAAGESFALPLVRRFHLSNTRLTTGIQIQNTSGSEVTVNLEIYDYDGDRLAAADPAALTIPANGSGNFWNGNLANVPTLPPSAGGFGWFGSAVLRATGPVVVVVSDEGYGPTAVDSANYNALLIP